MSDFQHHYKNAFSVDGSLRDIYVQGTTTQDWQKLLTFLRTSSYSIKFIVDGRQRPIPERIEEIFTLAHDVGVTFCLDEAHLALNCHFFTSEEIELDFDPHEMRSEQHLSRLLDFIRTIGRLLNKVVILTPENASSVLLFRFDPRTNEEKWFGEDSNY